MFDTIHPKKRLFVVPYRPRSQTPPTIRLEETAVLDASPLTNHQVLHKILVQSHWVIVHLQHNLKYRKLSTINPS